MVVCRMAAFSNDTAEAMINYNDTVLRMQLNISIFSAFCIFTGRNFVGFTDLVLMYFEYLPGNILRDLPIWFCRIPNIRRANFHLIAAMHMEPVCEVKLPQISISWISAA